MKIAQSARNPALFCCLRLLQAPFISRNSGGSSLCIPLLIWKAKWLRLLLDFSTYPMHISTNSRYRRMRFQNITVSIKSLTVSGLIVPLPLSSPEKFMLLRSSSFKGCSPTNWLKILSRFSTVESLSASSSRRLCRIRACSH